MGKSRKEEVYGMLGKSESLLVVNDKVLPGSLVFESLNPFPGYYDHQVSDPKPVYLYLALDREYSVFDIERAKMDVKKRYDWKFEAAKGKLDIYDRHYDVVRLRHLDSFDQLVHIQQEFINAGVKMKMAHVSSGNNLNGYLQLAKIFNVRKIEKGIYLDTSEDFHAYLILPCHLAPEAFNSVKLKVEYNWDLTGFDAAVGCFFIGGKLKEMVRIYSKDLSLEYLGKLRDLYLSKVKGN